MLIRSLLPLRWMHAGDILYIKASIFTQTFTWLKSTPWIYQTLSVAPGTFRLRRRHAHTLRLFITVHNTKLWWKIPWQQWHAESKIISWCLFYNLESTSAQSSRNDSFYLQFYRTMVHCWHNTVTALITLYCTSIMFDILSWSTAVA